MKKNLLIGILLVCNLVTIGYAIQQSSESERFKEIAEELQFEAEQTKRNREKAQQITQQFMQEAIEQKALEEKVSGGKE